MIIFAPYTVDHALADSSIVQATVTGFNPFTHVKYLLRQFKRHKGKGYSVEWKMKNIEDIKQEEAVE